MSFLPFAWILGFLGSLHCAVMCGPLMLSLPLQKGGFIKDFIVMLQYQLGRILVYTMLGVFAGLLGSNIRAYTDHNYFSIGLGLLLIIAALLYFSRKRFSFIENILQKPAVYLSRKAGKFYGTPFWGFIAGMLNGIIPCGMVYLALATALNSGSVQESAWFMLLFGLGTVPMMLFISAGKIYLKRYIRFNPTKLIPWFTLFLGVIFITRAMSLGIPFISPAHHISPGGQATECK